jgi:hypothetical protein
MRGTRAGTLTLTMLLAMAGPPAAQAVEPAAGQTSVQVAAQASALSAGALIRTPAPVAKATGRVGVTYVAPEKFRDREFRQANSRASALAEFDRWFAEMGTRYLPAGQSLRVEVLDMDLAGDFEPWRSGWEDVRFLRDTTPPRIHMLWQLEQGGKVVRQGDAKLTDMNYLWDARGRNDSGRFVYDKLLIEDWFRKTFAGKISG